MTESPLRPTDATSVPAGHDIIARSHRLDGDTAQLIDYYRSWAPHYDDTVSEDGYCGPRICADLFADTVLSGTGPARLKVLDAGCGTGLLGRELVNYPSIELHGVDLSSDMADIAQGSGLYHQVRGDIDLSIETNIRSESFDATVCCGVFTTGHLPANALHEFIRITTNGGCIVLSVRRSYSRAAGFTRYINDLSTRGVVEVIAHLEDAPYISDEGADYWSLRVR